MRTSETPRRVNNKGMKQLSEIRLREGDDLRAKIIQEISKAETSKRDWKTIQGAL
jgi:hypothetical protein